MSCSSSGWNVGNCSRRSIQCAAACLNASTPRACALRPQRAVPRMNTRSAALQARDSAASFEATAMANSACSACDAGYAPSKPLSSAVISALADSMHSVSRMRARRSSNDSMSGATSAADGKCSVITNPFIQVMRFPGCADSPPGPRHQDWGCLFHRDRRSSTPASSPGMLHAS